MRLRQVLAILLDNAIKFTALGGAVSVRAGRFDQSSDFLLVEVTDTGCGIAPEDLERIFERLYQTGGEDCEGQRGLGLGLYIARELVSRMGGQIWATSEPQRGSCFYFTLPVFSLAEWIAPALEQQTGQGDAVFLYSIRVTLPAPSLELTGELRQEIRRLLTSCLRSGAEVLLPEMCPRGNLLFVVTSTPRESGEELEKLIRAAFEGSAALRAAGVGCAVSCSAVPAPIQELSSPQAVQTRLSAELQIRVNHLCAQGGAQA
jgi:Histidine kinase-, DNA gyrase B-, and HSP90-like ATPase